MHIQVLRRMDIMELDLLQSAERSKKLKWERGKSFSWLNMGNGDPLPSATNSKHSASGGNV